MLDEELSRALAAWPDGPLCVAFSGGVDSTALLHALAANRDARARGMRCVHVDHGLHAQSTAWAAQASRFAASLGVRCDVAPVQVDRDSGTGLEAAARHARYAAFEAALQPGEILVTAHHADDQAETLLLRLMRGSGVEGLASMQSIRPFAQGWLARPWLAVPRDEIRAYASAHALAWIDDPSNDNASHDRNFVRSRVLPALRERWPHAEASLARSAGLLREAARVVADETRRELAMAQGLDPATVSVDALRKLEPFVRNEVVRAWIASLGLPAPTAVALDELGTLLDAREDATPIVAWRGAELRRYRDLAYAMATLPVVDGSWRVEWDGASGLELPFGLGALSVRESVGASAPPTVIPTVARKLTVSFRRGGERMRVRASGPNRAVKDLLQELGVPPWLRDRVPLVRDAEGVVALGDLIVAERFRGRLHWVRAAV